MFWLEYIHPHTYSHVTHKQVRLVEPDWYRRRWWTSVSKTTCLLGICMKRGCSCPTPLCNTASYETFCIGTSTGSTVWWHSTTATYRAGDLTQEQLYAYVHMELLAHSRNVCTHAWAGWLYYTWYTAIRSAQHMWRRVTSHAHWPHYRKGSLKYLVM